MATLIGAPVIIALIAGVAVPGVIIGVPVWAGRKIFKKFNKPQYSKAKRNLLVTLGVLGSVVASPIIATLAVGIGVPILLAYVYGVSDRHLGNECDMVFLRSFRFRYVERVVAVLEHEVTCQMEMDRI